MKISVLPKRGCYIWYASAYCNNTKGVLIPIYTYSLIVKLVKMTVFVGDQFSFKNKNQR